MLLWKIISVCLVTCLVPKITPRTTAGKISTTDSAAAAVRAADPRVTRRGRALSSSLGQLLAHSRLSCKVRPGCSGLYPAWSRKLPKMEAQLPPWATCSTDWLSSWDLTVLLNVQPKPLLIPLIPVVPRPLTVHHWEELCSVYFANILTHTGKLLLSHLFSRLKKLFSVRSFSSQGKCSCPLTSLVALCWTCTSLPVSFPKLDAIL